MHRIVIIFLCGLMIASCGDEATAPTPAPSNNEAPAATPVALRMLMKRVERGVDFDVLVVAVDAEGQLIEGGEVTITSSRGRVEAKGPNGVRVITDGTGRYRIRAEAPGGLVVEQEALVFAEVSAGWEQPRVVEGLVNTPAWEDGAAISPDGQWLMVQYLPVPIDCILGLDKEAPSCAKVIGPVGPPERPRMPGAARVAADGSITHGCPSIGIPELPFPVPPNALYGFKRQPDGSFAEPFVIYYDGIDGCISPYGPSMRGGKAAGTILSFALDSPLDNDAGDSGGDLFAASVTLGQDVVLGRFMNEAGAITLVDRIDAPLGEPTADNRGNPHVWDTPEGGRWVFFDDETGREDLFLARSSAGDGVRELGEPELIPAPVSVEGEQESQPWFDGRQLLFRRGITLMTSELDGDPAEAGSWSEPQVLLRGEPGGTGTLLGAGEPTVATINGYRELYFIFIEQAEGRLDLGVGVVQERIGED